MPNHSFGEELGNAVAPAVVFTPTADGPALVPAALDVALSISIGQVEIPWLSWHPTGDSKWRLALKFDALFRAG